MSVVVTGGAGYIGSHVALELVAAGLEPVLFDNFSNSSPAVLPMLEKLAGRTVPCIEGDIRECGDLDRALGNGDVSTVLHLAASKAVSESVDDPLRCYANNVAGSVCLAERMAHHGVRELVFSSTALVYAAADGPLSEDAPTVASSPYGRTKLDVARGHVLAVKRIASRPGVSVHNLGSQRGHSVLDVLAAFRRASGGMGTAWPAPPGHAAGPGGRVNGEVRNPNALGAAATALESH